MSLKCSDADNFHKQSEAAVTPGGRSYVTAYRAGSGIIVIVDVLVDEDVVLGGGLRQRVCARVWVCVG